MPPLCPDRRGRVPLLRPSRCARHATAVSRAIDEIPEGTRYEIGFPLEVLPGSDTASLARTLLEDGLTRARVGQQLVDLTAEWLSAPSPG